MAQIHFLARPPRLPPLHQRVPDFLEQLHLARRRRLALRVFLLLAAQLVHPLDRHEQHEGDDAKLITLLMNSPKLMVAAPTCLAAASEG